MVAILTLQTLCWQARIIFILLMVAWALEQMRIWMS